MSIGRLIACLMLTSVASFATVPAQAETKVLRVVPHADLTQLDPVFASIVITREYGLLIYEELFAWDSKLQPRPQMVDSWTTSPDNAASIRVAETLGSQLQRQDQLYVVGMSIPEPAQPPAPDH